MVITSYLLIVVFMICEILAAWGWGKDIPVALMPLGLAFLAASILAQGWPWKRPLP